MIIRLFHNSPLIASVISGLRRLIRRSPEYLQIIHKRPFQIRYHIGKLKITAN